MFEHDRRAKGRLSQCGITLLEVLVVMTLMAILSALVYPSFGNALSDLRLKGAARQIISACRLAKWEAVSTRQPYRLLVDMEKNRFFVEDVAGRRSKEIDLSSGLRVFRTQKIAENGSADSVAFYFFPNGTAEAGSIVVRDSRGKDLTLKIDLLTGDASIQEQAAP